MNFFNCSFDGNLSIPQHKFQFPMRYDVKICRHLSCYVFCVRRKLHQSFSILVGWHGCDILNGKSQRSLTCALWQKLCHLPAGFQPVWSFPSEDSAKPTEVGVMPLLLKREIWWDVWTICSTTFLPRGTVKPPKRWRRKVREFRNPKKKWPETWRLRMYSI